MGPSPIAMATSPLMNTGEFPVLVTYSIDRDETMTEAIVNAFEAARIDVFDRSTQLADWINVEAIESLQWTSKHPPNLCTWVWKHPVVITPDEIEIYTQSTITYGH